MMFTGQLLARIGLGVCVISLIFQILGISCPGWLVVITNLSILNSLTNGNIDSLGGEVETKSAVWYVRVCLNLDTQHECSSFSPHNAWRMGFKLTTVFSDLADLNWTEVKIELTMAIVCCLFGVILIVLMFWDPPIVTRKLLTITSSSFMVISGILILPAVIKVGISIENTKDKLSSLGQGTDFIGVHTSWALILSATGLVSAFVASVLLIVAAFKYDEITSIVTPHDKHETMDLSSFAMRLTKFPFAVANVTESDLEGHLPPKLPSSTTTLPRIGAKDDLEDHLPPKLLPRTTNLPRIGTKDDEPLAFQKVSLSREDTMFDPYVRFPNMMNENNIDEIIEEDDDSENDVKHKQNNVGNSLELV
ncbi:hypothetical protein ACF0H5_000618 [Mactra antiquata]